MKIAMVSEHANPLAVVGGVDSGGQNVHVAALATALGAAGHDVVVHTRRDDPALPDRVAMCDGVIVEHVPAGPPRPVPRDALLPYMGEFGRQLADSWRRDSPDVVHAHFWMSGLAALLGSRDRPFGVVQTFHALGTVKRRHQGSADTSPPERLRLEAAVGRTVAGVVATCHEEVDELSRMGVRRAAVTVVPCGVDLDLFREYGPALPRTGRPRLVTLGRLVERKGIQTVIEALPLLGDVELLVAGGPDALGLDDDPDVRRLRDVAGRHGVADRVRFLGRVLREDVPALLRSADVVVTVPWYEPFGITPLEAMACGRPVVASSVGGLLDTVLDGASGLLVPPRRPDLLAGALRPLLRDEVGREEMGMFAGVHVRARYGWKRIAEETARCYDLAVPDPVAAYPVGARR